MNEVNPICLKCKSLLWSNGDTSNNWKYFNCKKCNYGEAILLGKWLPTDENTNELFYEVARRLTEESDIRISESIEYTEEFYIKFTDNEFCKSIGIKPKDDDFFHHEFFKLLFYIKYFIIDKQEGDLAKFQEWYIANN